MGWIETSSNLISRNTHTQICSSDLARLDTAGLAGTKADAEARVVARAIAQEVFMTLLDGVVMGALWECGAGFCVKNGVLAV